MSSGMDSKRRQQQQQVCVPALHPQQMGAPCGAAPLGYPASPWVLWDAGQLMEAAARRRKKKRRLYAACLLAGVAFVVLAVAAIAGVAVYLAGTPPTESSGANWESFRRVGEATKYADEASNRRGVLGRHGVLVLPPPSTERTTAAPARSPWSIRREGSPWEGRGQQGDDPAPPRAANEGASAEEDGGELAAIEEGEEEGLEDLSGGVPEVAVVLDSEELEPVGDGSEAVGKVQGNPGHRSPHARASAKGTEAAPPAREETKASRPPPLSTSVEYATSISVEESPVKGPKGNGAQEWRRVEGLRREEGEEEEDDSVEGVVVEEEWRRGEERRYEQPHVSNKAASGGVPVFNILTKILNRANGSSGVKELENLEKKHAESNSTTMECSSGEFRCAVPNGGIMCLPGSSRCDGARDCFLHGEDEIGCTCADTLRSRFLHRKLCDGVPDCWDYSDEDQCDWCSPGYLVCGGGARTCVEPQRICDGIKDCPGGDDESRCIALSPEEIHKEPKMMGSDGRRFYHRGSNWNVSTRGSDYVTASMVTNEVLPYRSSGYLLVRKKGVWGKLCVDSSDSDGIKSKKGTREKTWGVADIGHEVCKAMTHRDFEMIEQVTDSDVIDGASSGPSKTPYYELQSSPDQNDILRSMQSFQSTECSSKKVMRVMCKDLECGVRPKIKVNQWSRIVGGGNAAPGAWPWQAALYREGEFQCGATLISDRWLVSAGHCFFRAPDDYWVARLGTLRRGSALPSPHEQRSPVSSIILHPRYVDEGFLNDIALLRLSTPVEITDHVRPICLPPRATHIPISSYHNPDSSTNIAGEEKEVVQVTTGDGTPHLYDEVMTTHPTIAHGYDSEPEDFSTQNPYTHHNPDEYSSTTEDNHKGSLHLSSHYEIANDTEATTFDSFELNASHPDSNDDETEQEPSTMTKLTYFGDVGDLENDREFTSWNITSITESLEDEMHENETGNDYTTEPMTSQPLSLISQHMGAQPVTEEIDLKDLIREVSSLFLSTNSRPVQHNAVNNLNVIQISDDKMKHEVADGIINESGKISSTNYNSDTSTTYLSQPTPFKFLNISTHQPFNRGTPDSLSEDKSPEFTVRNLTDYDQIKNKYFIEKPLEDKQSQENSNPTSPTFLKSENTYSNHIKSVYENPNVLQSNDKISEIKRLDRIAAPSVDGVAHAHEEESSTQPLSSETVEATYVEEATTNTKESNGTEGKDRKIRETSHGRRVDDGSDDGIRNGRMCTVVGWGQLFEVGKIFPDTLQEVELPLISTAECRKRTVFLPLYHLTDAMFCAGYDNGGRDACLGDSGGPLMCQEPDGHWSLYGVTSNGYGCARVNRPGVYTKVSHYIPWMEEAMAKEESALEEKRKRDEERWREEAGMGDEVWRQRWEWRRRRLEEQGAGKHHCPHRCPLGECLQKARVCNGVVDCSDASDEQSCHGDVRVGR